MINPLFTDLCRFLIFSINHWFTYLFDLPSPINIERMASRFPNISFEISYGHQIQTPFSDVPFPSDGGPSRSLDGGCGSRSHSYLFPIYHPSISFRLSLHTPCQPPSEASTIIVVAWPSSLLHCRYFAVDVYNTMMEEHERGQREWKGKTYISVRRSFCGKNGILLMPKLNYTTNFCF